MACAVKSCKNLKRFKPDGISFYQFPRDLNMRRKWYAVLDLRKPLNWATNQKFVCSNHFPENATSHAGRLKFNAVPSLNLVPEDNAENQPESEESISEAKHNGGANPDFIIDVSIGDHSAKEESDQSSPPSGLKRKRGNIIVQSDSSAPDILIKTLHSVILQRDRAKARLYQARKAIKDLKTKGVHLSQSDLSLSSASPDEDDDVPHLLMNRYIKNLQDGFASKEAYPEKLLQFAGTLQSCSPEAYNLVRSTFGRALPEPSTLKLMKLLES